MWRIKGEGEGIGMRRIKGEGSGEEGQGKMKGEARGG